LEAAGNHVTRGWRVYAKTKRPDRLDARSSGAQHTPYSLVDQAGWHLSRWDSSCHQTSSPLWRCRRNVPSSIRSKTSGQFLRDNCLSNRDHGCAAWNKIVDQPWRIMSIGKFLLGTILLSLGVVASANLWLAVAAAAAAGFLAKYPAGPEWARGPAAALRPALLMAFMLAVALPTPLRALPFSFLVG
jgi:hypothetical protein